MKNTKLLFTLFICMSVTRPSHNEFIKNDNASNKSLSNRCKCLPYYNCLTDRSFNYYGIKNIDPRKRRENKVLA